MRKTSVKGTEKGKLYGPGGLCKQVGSRVADFFLIAAFRAPRSEARDVWVAGPKGKHSKSQEEGASPKIRAGWHSFRNKLGLYKMMD